MASPVIQQVIGNLNYIGFYDFILPWLFAFALSFGIMKSAKIFNANEKVQVILSLVIAFFLTNYTPYGTTIGQFFSNLYGTGMFILAGMLLILMMVGLFFGDLSNADIFKKPLELVLDLLGIQTQKSQEIVIGGLLILIGVAVLLWAARNFGINLRFYVSPDVVATALVLGAVVLAVLFLTKGGESKGGG